MDAALALPLITGVLGACVGSFLNVVIYRLPRSEPELGGLSIRRPARSFCPGCKRQLRWFENLPIVSWLALGGRCRSCRQEISARYLFVELLTAFLFGGAAVVALDSMDGGGEGWVVLLASLYLVAVCVAVTFIDLDWRIIPDEITWPGMALGFIASVAAPAVQSQGWLFGKLFGHLGWERHLASAAASLAGIAAGAGVVWLVGWLGKRAFRPKDAETGEATDAMGFGDVKYMGLAGAFLGADGVLLVFFAGCVLGALGGVIYYAIKRDRYIPFGPFLSIGVLLVALFRVPLADFLLVDWPRMVQGLFSRSG